MTSDEIIMLFKNIFQKNYAFHSKVFWSKKEDQMLEKLISLKNLNKKIIKLFSLFQGKQGKAFSMEKNRNGFERNFQTKSSEKSFAMF